MSICGRQAALLPDRLKPIVRLDLENGAARAPRGASDRAPQCRFGRQVALLPDRLKPIVRLDLDNDAARASRGASGRAPQCRFVGGRPRCSCRNPDLMQCNQL